MAAAADTLRQFLSGVKTPEMAVPEFLAGTTLLKGVRFKPEREVRIVAIPELPPSRNMRHENSRKSLTRARRCLRFKRVPTQENGTYPYSPEWGSACL